MTDVEILWHECSTALRSFILRRVPDQYIAEDILQEVFVKIQSRIGTLREAEKIRPWLYQISRNTIVDYYRSKKPMVELPRSLPSPEIPIATDLIQDITPCIKRMVERLPGKYRQAVVMTAYQGLTQKQMGEILGLSASGAKSRIQRARKKLKKMMQDCCTFEVDSMGAVISYEPKHRSSHSQELTRES